MIHRITLTAAILAMMSGCVGGGSDDCKPFENCGASGGGAGTGGLAIIDRDNAIDVLREAWFIASTSADVPAFVVATGIGDTSGGVVFAPGPAAKIAGRTNVVVDPFGPTTYNCPTSGTFTVEGDVADPNTVTAGDFAIYSSSACDSGTGYVVEGGHRLDIVSVVGDPTSGMFEQGQTLTFTDFEATAASFVTLFDGDHSAIIDTTSSGEVAMSFSGNQLTIGEQGISTTATNYIGNTTVQTGSPFNATLSVSGRGSSTAVQGSFDYFTDETMVKPVGLPPSDGIFDVVGSGGAIARIAIVDETFLRIQLDGNGSGNFELSIDVSWQEFLSGNLVLNWSETGLN